MSANLLRHPATQEAPPGAGVFQRQGVLGPQVHVGRVIQVVLGNALKKLLYILAGLGGGFEGPDVAASLPGHVVEKVLHLLAADLPALGVLSLWKSVQRC